ncbi:MAG: glycosyltransferase [Oscillospiraceae bacterium]|nr:glycosyltransferase [Oscillospiraceae bacterium]
MKKLRILQVNKLYHPWIGGIESVAKTTAENLNDDTDMTVLVCQPKGKGVREQVNGVNVVRAGSLGIKFSMPISFSFPFLVRKYSKNTDVIILHEPFPLGDMAVLISGFRGKVILWWHSDIIKQKNLVKLINPIISKILKRADAIFTTSEGYIEGSAYIREYKEKCRIVPYGIDIDSYPVTPSQPILTDRLTDKGRKKLLFVGRLVYYKGVGVLLDAFKRVSGAELFIVGKGADEEALRAHAEQLGDRVHFIPPLSDEELKNAFADCDIFVLPSIEKSEAFGIVQLEAMICGKPVINTDLKTSVPLVSIDGETGLTVKAGDSEEMASAINRLIEDNSLRERFGKNAKRRVLEHFDIKIMTENIKNQCKKIMEE